MFGQVYSEGKRCWLVMLVRNYNKWHCGQTIFKSAISQITYPLGKGKQLMSLKECRSLQTLAHDPREYYSTVHPPVTQRSSTYSQNSGAVNLHCYWSRKGPADGLRASLCQVPLPSPKCCQVTTNQSNSMKSKRGGWRGRITAGRQRCLPSSSSFSPYIKKLRQWSSSCIAAPRQLFSRIMCLQNSLHVQNSASATGKQAISCFSMQTTIFCAYTMTVA